MASGLPEFTQPMKVCDGCLMSKQTIQSFPQQTEFHVRQALDLIHNDLFGPIAPDTVVGNMYIFLLIDDFSHMMWIYIYMLKSKDEALGAFKKF